jgi:hypothetical protein
MNQMEQMKEKIIELSKKQDLKITLIQTSNQQLWETERSHWVLAVVVAKSSSNMHVERFVLQMVLLF